MQVNPTKKTGELLEGNEGGIRYHALITNAEVGINKFNQDFEWAVSFRADEGIIRAWLKETMVRKLLRALNFTEDREYLTNEVIGQQIGITVGLNRAGDNPRVDAKRFYAVEQKTLSETAAAAVEDTVPF